MPQDYEAIVVGAGPAGSALALRLARSGHACALVDGARFPRGKVCGEGVMPAGVDALAALGLGAQVDALGQRFYGVRYVLPDGARAEGRFPHGRWALGIERRLLDACLLDAARAAGVHVRLGAWVRDVRLPSPGSGERVEVEVGGETLRAPVLVGADGGGSTVRRRAGLEGPPPQRARFGLGAHLRHPPRAEACPLVEVLLASTCELYLTPVGPEVTSVAVLLDRAGLERVRARGSLEDGLRVALAAAGPGAAHLREAPLVGRPRALGPLARSARAAHADGVLLVGDAAGALDPITGEGIAVALTTGRAAWEVLEGAFAAGDFSAARLAPWTARRRRALRPYAGLTRLLLHLAHRPARAARVVRSLARAPQTFDRLLGVAAGAPLRSLSLRDGVRVLLGV